jgi:hypothetical protein
MYPTLTATLQVVMIDEVGRMIENNLATQSSMPKSITSFTLKF